jgi:hypothetical protein
MIPSPAGVIRRGAAGGAIVLAAALAAGCSSSGGGGSSSDSVAPQSSSTAAPSATPSSSTPAPASSSVVAASLGAADVKAVKKAFVSFFNSDTDLAKAQALLQHGDVFKAALKAQSKSPQAQGLSVTVSKVVAQSKVVAVATFTLFSAGKAVLPDTPGYAVKDNGTWKIAAGTFCGLLKLQNAAPKECDDPAITAFPTG